VFRGSSSWDQEREEAANDRKKKEDDAKAWKEAVETGILTLSFGSGDGRQEVPIAEVDRRIRAKLVADVFGNHHARPQQQQQQQIRG